MRDISTSTDSLLDVSDGDVITVGRDLYTVDSKTKGGMSVVLFIKRKDDQQHRYLSLEREIAIKIPITNQTTIIPELRKWSLMNHQNILVLSEIAVSKDNGVVALSPKCDGSVRDIINRYSSIDEKSAYTIIRSAAEALYYAHLKHNILHLDIKPENILFNLSYCSDSKKYLNSRENIIETKFFITDWGISSSKYSSFDNSYKDDWLYTNNNAGTLPYMAPERYLKGWRSTPASDLFSLGVTWIELLTGLRPYETTTSIPSQILKGRYTLLAKELLREKKIKSSTIRIINSLIEPDPTKRINSWEKAIRILRPNLIQKLF
jgi:serine/threonine protein kinase